MLAIKLKIVGRKNQRTFRVIVQETRAKLGGKFVDDLGWYNPHTNQFKVNKERVQYWVENGARPTDSVEKLLRKVQSSEVTTYEARAGRKKNKGPKQEAGAEVPAEAPEGEVTSETEEAPAQDSEGGEQAESGDEAPAAPQEEQPAEEAPVEESSAEETETAPEEEKVEEKKED